MSKTLRIKKLPPHEAQKIAAGEVVERPANVVKELVENALDAEATQVAVHVEDGGKQLIRVIDNGCGMSAEDAQLCFEQHATSKIERVDDLGSLTTFGFRGEALSSIAAVSNVALITKDATAPHGTKLTLANGIITTKTAVPHGQGTDISIENLFYNIPARKKFLKAKETEWRQILQLMHAFCLDYQNVHFKLFHDGKQIINCPPTDKLFDRITQLWDHTVTQQMLPVTATDKSVHLYGAVSNHQQVKFNRASLFFFVNKRWIKNHQLSRALLKGYANVLPPGRYPSAFIFIEVDPERVDINIHPRKEEVQFLNPRSVETLLSATVKSALEEHVSTQIKQSVTFAQPTPTYTASSKSWQPVTHERVARQPFYPVKKPTFAPTQQQPLPIKKESATHAIIGQLNKTYILLEQEDGLFVVDQHAAHERILYELFSKRFEDVATIKLMFPTIITLNAADITLMEPYLSIFTQHGIAIEIFDKDKVAIRATPVHLKGVSLQDLLQQVVSWITEQGDVAQEDFFKTITEKLRAQMACKAAVKAGDELTMEKMQQLLNDLHKVENRFSCPHGRPTGWLLSTHEIEKKFKRRL